MQLRRLPTALLLGAVLLLVRAYVYLPVAAPRNSVLTPSMSPKPSRPVNRSVFAPPPNPDYVSPPPPPLKRPRMAPAAATRRFDKPPRSAPAPRDTTAQLLFMMKTVDSNVCAGVGGTHQNGRSCKLPCRAEEPLPLDPDATSILGNPNRTRLLWAADAGNFTGSWTAAVRSSQLATCGDPAQPTMCGFAAPSGFDAVRRLSSQGGAQCSIVVLTALLGALDHLRQPLHEPSADMADCYFAFVDRAAAAAAIQVAGTRSQRKARTGPTREATLQRAGVWRLLTLGDDLPFGTNARRNSRVPKMLPHRFFPQADFCLWVDAKLQLNVSPQVAVERFLRSRDAEFAALRNLRRHTIDHEHAWIDSWLCPHGSRAPAASAACESVQAQWQHYTHEQEAHPGWLAQTVVIEGALLLLDLRSTATQCLLCSWFNEYVRFGERDQLSFAYVLHTQRHRPRAHLLPRRFHWSATVSADTITCYNATDEDAMALAVRFQHGNGAVVQARRQAPNERRPRQRTKDHAAAR